MNCSSTQLEDGEQSNLERNAIATAPLAFSSDPTLVPATSRLVIPTTFDGQRTSTTSRSWMNVEVFEHNNTTSTSPLVIFIPGICESAETITVQEMASWAKSIPVRLAVLELPGHGLSSGTLVDLPMNLDLLVQQVLHAISQILKALLGGGAASAADDAAASHKIPYLLSGSSFGGTLALYAAESISRRIQLSKTTGTTTTTTKTTTKSSTEQPGDFWKELDGKGTLTAVVSVTPAVGVDPEVLPPNWIVSSLALASALFPKAQLPFTPMEDSAQYDCPTTSTRNFKGRWPLAISKFLLDLTSTIVPTDVEQGRLALLHIPKVILLAGAKDVMIPLTSIQALEAKLQTPSKQVVVFPKVGHDVLSNPKSSSKALEILFGALL